MHTNLLITKSSSLRAFISQMMIGAREKPFLEDILARQCAVPFCKNWKVRGMAEAARTERLMSEAAAQRSAADAGREQTAGAAGTGATDSSTPPAPPTLLAPGEQQQPQQPATELPEDTSLFRAAQSEWHRAAAGLRRDGAAAATAGMLQRALTGRFALGKSAGDVIRRGRG
jgi:hypothetical protein